MRMTTLWILLIALALPLACSRAQETADDAASSAAEALTQIRSCRRSPCAATVSK